MGYYAKLVHGSKVFNLNDAVYSLGDDFIPPGASEQTNWSGMAMSNEFYGASSLSQRGQDREFTFSVHITGLSDAQVTFAASLLERFLRLSRDKSDTLYLEFRGDNDVSVSPLWGTYGAPLRYEIKKLNSFVLSPVMGQSDAWRRHMGYNRITVTVAPYAEKADQRLGTATGGILEDNWGTPDGSSRGLIVPEATTNKCTNPVFGNADWDNGWTAIATTGLLISQNTDPQYCLPGLISSAAIQYTNAPETLSIYAQSINVGNTNNHTFSALVKMPDGSAPTSSDVVIYYNINKTTTYTNLGNGIYLLSATTAGINGATNTGIAILGAKKIYLLAYQCEEKAYHTPICWGTLMGCAWTGTAHASTTTRTAAMCKVDGADIYDPGQGTIVVVWKSPPVLTGAAFYLFHTSTNSRLYLYCNGSNSYTLSDGTNSATATSQTIAANTIYVFHCVYGPAGMTLYVSGTSQATQATFLPAAVDGYIAIGTDATATAHANGTFLGVVPYNKPMTAAEVTASYNNIYRQVTGGDGLGQRLSAIPWLWTKDGDDVIDNHNDSGHDNFAVIGGIPGSADARIRALVTVSSSSTSWEGWLIKSSSPGGDFITPSWQWVADANNTSIGAGATYSGGKITSFTINTTGTAVISTEPFRSYMDWGNTHYFIRLDDTGSDLKTAPMFNFNETGNIFGDFKAISGKSTSRMFYSGSMFIGFPPYAKKSDLIVHPKVWLKRTTGSHVLKVDCGYILPSQLWKIRSAISTSEGAFAKFVVHKGRGYEVNSTGVIVKPSLTFGDEITLSPQRNNYLFGLSGKDGSAHVIADTFTFTDFYVTPRYSIV